MIYITGDIHGDPKKRFCTFGFNSTLTKKDYVIICGDFGCIWTNDPSYRETIEDEILSWLNNQPWTTLFVDGNHENFDQLKKYPVEEWHGGKVHRIKSSILHLMRGEIYNIDGYKIFTFGGARSHDIDSGILEKNDERLQFWRFDKYKQFRINHVTWWKDEMPTPDEMEYAFNNLKSNDLNVDVIITHDVPDWILNNDPFKKYNLTTDNLNNFLGMISNVVSYSKWYSGHYHIDYRVNDKHDMLYSDIIPLVDPPNKSLPNKKKKRSIKSIKFDKQYYKEKQMEEKKEIDSRPDKAF